MIEIRHMSPKKRILSIILTVLIFSIVFAAAIFFHTRNMNNYFKQTSEITNKDSLDLRVENTWINHGYLFFNNKYFIYSARVIQPSIDLSQIVELTTPFYIKKNSSSDTLRLLQNDSVYIFILKSKR
jgi:hypothetical protein